MRCALASLSTALLLVSACKRSTPAPVASEPPASSAPVGSGGRTADAGPTVARAQGSTCTMAPPHGVTVGAAGGYAHQIAASRAGVIVTWLERRDPRSGRGWREVVELARTFDESLTPRGDAKVVFRQGYPDAYANGIAPYASETELGAATCGWAAFAGKLDCSVGPIGGAPLGKLASVLGMMGPDTDRIGVALVGRRPVVVYPVCHTVNAFGSKGRTWRLTPAAGEGSECDKSMDVVAAAPLGADRAFGVWRRRGAIEGREIAADGGPRGALVTVSEAGALVGAPAIGTRGDDVVVAYASAAKAADPWVVTLATRKGSEPFVRTALVTGDAPAMAPAVTASADPSCLLLSWTEGRGKSTRAFAASVCDGRISGERIAVSGDGIEAGDTELAPAPDGAYVVWQEVPATGPAELRVAHLRCTNRR